MSCWLLQGTGGVSPELPQLFDPGYLGMTLWHGDRENQGLGSGRGLCNSLCDLMKANNALWFRQVGLGR